MKKLACDACGSAEIYSIYHLARIPAFQNKLFPSATVAQTAPAAAVDLTACRDCGFIFNALFDNGLMDYDGDYQNAQDHSPSFQSYLDDIANLIVSGATPKDRIVEIGCGKGYFLETLKARGLNVKGFDPTYEGDSADIVKSYFNADTAADVDADIVIMRHTLEHIEGPYAFLQQLKKILRPECKIFIEIPRVEWIVEHKAFWDIFHEHCNYFSEFFFQKVFSGHCDIHRVFSDQYMLVGAKIGDLVDKIEAGGAPDYSDLFTGEIGKYAQIVNAADRNFIWGAGAKGIAFANILDEARSKVPALVDINPRKQNCFISLTGHACVAPEEIDWSALQDNDCLWIMNSRYKNEILATLPALPCRVIVLGDDQ